MRRMPIAIGAWAGALLLLTLSGAFTTNHYSGTSGSLTGSSKAIVILMTLLGAVVGGIVGAWVSRERA